MHLPRYGHHRHARRVTLVALATLLAATLVGMDEQPNDAAAASSIYLGVYQQGAPWSMAPLDEFERAAGKRAAIVMWYQDWVVARSLDTTMLRNVAARGAVPMITWDPWDYTKGTNQPDFRLQTIIDGTHDAYIQSWAAGLKDYSGPVLLRFAHEMNGNWYPWGAGVNGNTAAQYVQAWQRVRGIFTAAGATNVRWLWSPNILLGATDFTPFYPGDAAVDWVGLDGYNWGGRGSWTSFAALFGPSYQHLTALSQKPVMVAEVASAEDGGSKAAWITDAYSTQIPTKFPRIQAVIWFNENKERDWRIQSSPRARRAFADAAAAPLYRTSWP